MLAHGQFPPPAGQIGSTAIYKDSAVFVAWASGCNVVRGWQNIADTSLGKADVGDSSLALGPAGSNGVVSLGDAGTAIITFDRPVANGPSWDFAVFENSFSDTFLELAFVEVSSDGLNYIRFPSTSLTDTNVQVGTYGELDATKLNNLAGKYRLFYGTPFDLQELESVSSLDINHITHIKIIDVVGSIEPAYASYDAFHHKINDPWPTPFGASGFDLDAVGVIHQAPAGISESQDESMALVYPNPAGNYVTVSLKGLNPVSDILLINYNGQVICRKKCAGHDETIDLQGLPAGLYMIKIIHDESVLCKKLIKY